MFNRLSDPDYRHKYTTWALIRHVICKVTSNLSPLKKNLTSKKHIIYLHNVVELKYTVAEHWKYSSKAQIILNCTYNS